MIEGILITPLQRIPNEKGDIFHAMKASSAGFNGFGEAYFSKIYRNQIKGWKRHKTAALNLVVIAGSVHFVIAKERPGEGLYPHCKFYDITLDPKKNYCRLTIEPGLWVAFKGLSEPESIVLNISSEEHDPLESEMLPIKKWPF